MNRCNFEMKTENKKCVSPVTKFFYLLHWSNTLSIEYCDWVHCDAASMWLRAIWISWSVCQWHLSLETDTVWQCHCHWQVSCHMSMPMCQYAIVTVTGHTWLAVHCIVTCQCHVTCYCSHYLLFTKLHSHKLSTGCTEYLLFTMQNCYYIKIFQEYFFYSF